MWRYQNILQINRQKYYINKIALQHALQAPSWKFAIQFCCTVQMPKFSCLLNCLCKQTLLFLMKFLFLFIAIIAMKNGAFSRIKQSYLGFYLTSPQWTDEMKGYEIESLFFRKTFPLFFHSSDFLKKKKII